MKPIVADSAAIAEAVALLRQGRLVAFPTETVYGLGADASNPEAVQRIFAAKGRPANHPLIVHLPSQDSLRDWAAEVPESAQKLAAHFWPGPLALVLKKRPEVSAVVTGGQDTIALRVPNHPVALNLLKAFAGGIAAPSANRFCRISPTLAEHVAEELGESVDLILDGGACQVGVESTIVDLSGEVPRLLRPGKISQADIEAVLQTALVFPHAKAVTDLRAPGMMDVHYAPTTLAVRCASAALPTRIKELVASGKRVGVLTYQQKIVQNQDVQVLTIPKEAELYAQQLYVSLRTLDGLNLDIILVETPPETMSWYAINDRLNKATVIL